MSKLKEGISKEELKLLKGMYWRSQNYAMLWSYSRWCGNATTWILYPYINWLYPNPEDKGKKIEALKRERGLMNITPQMAPIMYSLFANMAYAESIVERFAHNTTRIETGDVNMQQHLSHA